MATYLYFYTICKAANAVRVRNYNPDPDNTSLITHSYGRGLKRFQA